MFLSFSLSLFVVNFREGISKNFFKLRRENFYCHFLLFLSILLFSGRGEKKNKGKNPVKCINENLRIRKDK